uniref:Kinesin-like protein KIF2A-like N-terminal domain-containing protein n=1 Tax=Ditylenchus dipsaci TaxID=166011 RepID=A0A915DS90_9BILA
MRSLKISFSAISETNKASAINCCKGSIRSDGRVHQATVTKVLPRGAGVSVQWFEDGSEKARKSRGRSAQFEPAISHRMSLGVASTNSKDIDTSLLSVNGIGDQMAQPISKKITQLKNTANSAMNRTLKNQVARSTCVASKQSENKRPQSIRTSNFAK